MRREQAKQYAAAAVRTLLALTGDDPDRDGLRDTPERVIKSYGELFSGYDTDPAAVLKQFENVPYRGMVIIRDIEFYSMCEHHMLPFFGSAHIAYIPGDGNRVVGASKLPRLLEVFARRLQVQERICEQVTDALMSNLEPRGAACVIDARHMCICGRGVGKQSAIMTTESLRGAFWEDAACRGEFLEALRRSG